MNRRNAVVALSAATLLAAPKKSGIRARFEGVWKLVSYESKDNASGELRHPYGMNPVGRLIYDSAGRMSAQLLNPGRRPIGGPPTRSSVQSLRDASPEDMREILMGFNSYFGTFDVEESTSTVIHHVQGCLIPSWIGQDLRRGYEFSGDDRLILTPPYQQVTNRLVWQREA